MTNLLPGQIATLAVMGVFAIVVIGALIGTVVHLIRHGLEGIEPSDLDRTPGDW